VPQAKQHIKPEIMRKYVEELSQTIGTYDFHIFGGEPFLNHIGIEELVETFFELDFFPADSLGIVASGYVLPSRAMAALDKASKEIVKRGGMGTYLTFTNHEYLADAILAHRGIDPESLAGADPAIKEWILEEVRKETVSRLGQSEIDFSDPHPFKLYPNIVTNVRDYEEVGEVKLADVGNATTIQGQRFFHKNDVEHMNPNMVIGYEPYGRLQLKSLGIDNEGNIKKRGLDTSEGTKQNNHGNIKDGLQGAVLNQATYSETIGRAVECQNKNVRQHYSASIMSL